MMKIVASLVILGLCANVAFALTGLAPVSSGQGSAFSGLNSSATKIWNVANATDAAIYDSSATTNDGAGVTYTNVWFGPGASNDTSYVWSIAASGTTESSSITIANEGSQSSTIVNTLRKRTINNTIVGWANDTTEASVIGDAPVTVSIQAVDGFTTAVGPGYFAALSSGPDTKTAVNNQVFVTIVTGSSGSATTTTVTTITDVLASSSTTPTCTFTSFNLGNIWYDIGAGAFFYTYSKLVNTYAVGSSSACGSDSTGNTEAYTIHVGGIFVNGTAFWTTPLTITPVTGTHGVSNLVGGGDNWLNASNIIVAYKDAELSPNPTSYYSKTAKVTTTTAAGSPSALVADSTSGTQNSASSTYLTYTYTPTAVWASNATYGIAVACKNGSQTQAQYTTSSTTFTYTYSFTNYLNSTLTAADSGLSLTSTNAVGKFYGWQLNTGYTLVAVSVGSTTNSYVWGTFYGNGTVNQTSTTLGSLTYDQVSVYQDKNGTMWIGWQDVDTANAGAGNGDFTYAGYLAKLQGQLNVPTGASVLSVISAFFVLFLAAIFVF